MLGPRSDESVQLGPVLVTEVGVAEARVIDPCCVPGGQTEGMPFSFRSHRNGYPGIVPGTTVVVVRHHRGMNIPDRPQYPAIHHIVEQSFAQHRRRGFPLGDLDRLALA